MLLNLRKILFDRFEKIEVKLNHEIFHPIFLSYIQAFDTSFVIDTRVDIFKFRFFITPLKVSKSNSARDSGSMGIFLKKSHPLKRECNQEIYPSKRDTLAN